jgi:GDPmannose 4,6-dehydratase
MSDKVAVITGVTGQDGWYLAQLLLARSYRVFGTSSDQYASQTTIIPGVELLHWDLRDEAALADLLRRVQPTEFYNCAGYASGSGMFDDPVAMGDINGLAVARILEAIRATGTNSRFCQASSSEMFGAPLASPQCEETPFRPLSPYGAAKLFGHQMVGMHRKRYGMFACSAILFNHESPRRPHGFVTRKVSDGAARIKLGLSDDLALGNLETRRDWGFSGDYMLGAWLMLQAERADDYVLATGQTRSVRELCRLAFEHVGLDYRDYVREDAALYRPIETGALVGDASKAADRLGWSPQLTFPNLVRAMVDADLERLRVAHSGAD